MAIFKKTLGYSLAIWLAIFAGSDVSAYQAAGPKQAEAESTEKADAPKPAKPKSAKKWFGELQAVGRKYQKGETIAQTDVARNELIQNITADLDGSSIKFRTKVREVKWKDGIAKISTQLEFSTEVDRRSPLRITRVAPIEIEMTQDEAAKIAPGQRIEFSGELTFHPRRWGAVGVATSSQQMYSLRHEFIAGGYLGTFTSSKFICTIDGNDVTPRWVAKPKRAAGG